MKRFFELAFQQTQVTAADFADQAYPKQIAINNTTTPLLVQNAQQSFARTMMQLIADGHPLTEGLTNTQVMMTTAMKEYYAFLDVWEVDDNGKVTDRFKQQHAGLSIVAETAAGPIPIADTLDPSSPNYMHWYNPDVATNNATVAGCTEDPITFPASGVTLHYLLYGSLDGHKSSTGVQCPPTGGSATAPQLTIADFADWTHGDDPRAQDRRGGDAVLGSAVAAHGDRAGADHPAHRLLQHAGVLRELADQHQQPDARHPEPDADRRARLVGRRHRQHDDAGQSAAGPGHRARGQPGSAASATRRWIRCGRSSRRTTPGTITTSWTRR